MGNTNSSLDKDLLDKGSLTKIWARITELFVRKDGLQSSLNTAVQNLEIVNTEPAQASLSTEQPSFAASQNNG